VVTASPERGAAVSAEYPDAVVLDSPDALFARAHDFDLVVVGTPNSSHVPLARRAIAAGLAVVVDKPVAIASADARALVAEANDAGVPLTVFQNRRWDGDFLTLQELIAGGEAGEIRTFETAFEWWTPKVRTKWKDTTPAAEGGGLVYDLAPHLVDQAIRLFGPVGEVRAELDRRRPGAVAEDDALVSLRHESGVRSRLWMSAVAPVPRPRFRVVGSRAVVEVHGLDPQEGQSIAGLRPRDSGYGVSDPDRVARVRTPEGERPVPLRPGAHLEFYRLLADALLDGAPLPVDPADSIRGLEVIERALAEVR